MTRRPQQQPWQLAKELAITVVEYQGRSVSTKQPKSTQNWLLKLKPDSNDSGGQNDSFVELDEPSAQLLGINVSRNLAGAVLRVTLTPVATPKKLAETRKNQDIDIDAISPLMLIATRLSDGSAYRFAAHRSGLKKESEGYFLEVNTCELTHSGYFEIFRKPRIKLSLPLSKEEFLILERIIADEIEPQPFFRAKFGVRYPKGVKS